MDPMRFSHVLFALMAIAAPAFAAPATTEYKGICEASAGAYVDPEHFLVASDETNVLRLYRRGVVDPVLKVDFQAFIGHDKSDLEGAARIEDKVYWISSHSFNSRGEDKMKRRVFFATKTTALGGAINTVGIGKVVTNLRDGLAAAAKVAPKDLNVEGLAATPDGGLLIGLRSPLRGSSAIVVPLKNPAGVIEGADAVWGAALEVQLEGLAIRSMELMSAPGSGYFIMAGSQKDSNDEFRLFKWSGTRPETERLDGIDLNGIKPEGLMQVPGTGKWHLLSDDGDVCSDEGLEPQRRFRSTVIDAK
ncbi:DUF3616 domain-containing protein [Bradyrhizobium sp.]|uniref:DUF3616 domain-containing protein n=1 Tax=Bradyrhizobium sp. TaxID=376 RepID=UPI004037C6E7